MIIEPHTPLIVPRRPPLILPGRDRRKKAQAAPMVYTSFFERNRPPSDPGGGGGGPAASQLLLHFDGSNGATTTTDSSASAHTVTMGGGATISTAQQVFGASSCLFAGSDYCSIPNHSDFAFGNGSFTLNARCRWTSLPGGIAYDALMAFWDNAGTSTYGWMFYVQHSSGGTIFGMGFQFRNSGGTLRTKAVSGVSLAINTWYALSVDYDAAADKLRFYKDGVQQGADLTTSGESIQSTTAPLVIGAQKSGASYFNDFLGYMDEVRVVKGSAEYKGAYTPESAAFTT